MLKLRNMHIAVLIVCYVLLCLQQAKAQCGCPDEPGTINLGTPVPAGTKMIAGNPGSWHCQSGHVGPSSCAVDFNADGASDADDGMPVLAVADGTITRIEYNAGGFGYYIILNHGSGLETYYAHLKFKPSKNPGVAVGDRVRKGNVIGFIGTTGNSSNTHLHFELRRNGSSINFEFMDNQAVSNTTRIISQNGLVAADHASHFDGMLIKPSRVDSPYGFNTIFYVEGNKLRPFTSWEHYRSWNYDSGHFVVSVSDAELGRYAAAGMGTAMSFRPGTLVKSTDNSTIYVVEYQNGEARKRPFTSWQQFTDLGYSETNVMRVPPSLLNESVLPTNGNVSTADQGFLYSLSAAPASNTVTAGGSIQFTVSATFSNGFSGPLQDLRVLDLPQGITATFSPTSITHSGGTTTLTLTTSASAPVGTTRLMVAASGDGLMANIDLTINNGQQAGNSQIEIWWPNDGIQVSGSQPFKAIVTNLQLSQYNLYWQVDGGQLNIMFDNSQDYPHKEVQVDLSGWTWRGNGPYVVNFVARDLSGNIITQRAINLYVIH